MKQLFVNAPNNINSIKKQRPQFLISLFRPREIYFMLHFQFEYSKNQFKKYTKIIFNWHKNIVWTDPNISWNEFNLITYPNGYFEVNKRHPNLFGHPSFDRKCIMSNSSLNNEFINKNTNRIECC